MPLTEATIKSTKPRTSAYKLFDGGGLFLLVKPTGAKGWRIKYRFAGTERLLSFGPYPRVSLREARALRDTLKRELAQGIEPSTKRKAEKAAIVSSHANSFEAIALEWHSAQSNKWKPEHSKRILSRMQRNLFPDIGNRPVSMISASEILSIMRQMETRGVFDQTRRVLQYCGAVLRYATATGRAARDVTVDLRGSLAAKPSTKHHASITDPQKIGLLLRQIDSYQGTPTTHAALRLAPLVFLRPGELRKGEWREIDFERKEWRVHLDRMKMKETHIVPLSRQALVILQELRVITGNQQFIFPSSFKTDQPLSENALNYGLRKLGYSGNEMTSHGFRSLASTLLNEQGWSRDAIERQLSHAPRDAVRAAYNYAEYLPERRKMMQAWADFLDSLRKTSTAQARSLPQAI
jgi:integrase